MTTRPESAPHASPRDCAGIVLQAPARRERGGDDFMACDYDVMVVVAGRAALPEPSPFCTFRVTWLAGCPVLDIRCRFGLRFLSNEALGTYSCSWGWRWWDGHYERQRSDKMCECGTGFFVKNPTPQHRDVAGRGLVQQAASVGGTTTADPGKTAEVRRVRQRFAHMQKSIWRMLRSIQARFCTPKLPRQSVDPQINGSKEPMLGMPVAMRCVRPLRMIWREAPC